MNRIGFLWSGRSLVGPKSEICDKVADEMFTYELKVCHQPSGEEMDLKFVNLPNVEPLLRGVYEELLNQGISQSDIFKYIPPLFYAQEVFVPNLDFPAPIAPVVVDDDASLCQPVDDQQAVASGVGESSSGEVSLKARPGKSSCDVCGAIITTSNLARHKDIHSTAPLPFECGSPCKKRALRREEIVSHQRTSACCKYLFISFHQIDTCPMPFLCPFFGRFSGSECAQCNLHVPGSMEQHRKNCQGAYPCPNCPSKVT